MELARHTSIGVTLRYMHLSPNHRMEAIALLDRRPVGPYLGTGKSVEPKNGVNR